MTLVSQVLVIGASGYLGREVLRLCGGDARGTYLRQAAADSLPYDFFTDDLDPLLRALDRVSTVIFTAAVERVPDSNETFPRAVNRFVDSVARAKLRLVYVSSDAVFSGQRGQYREDDAPDATTLYGTHLRLFESEVSQKLSRHVIVRASYLFGHTNSHDDRRRQEALDAIKNERVLFRYQNVFKSPVHVTQAADAIVKLAMGSESGIIHIPGERLSVLDFYRRQCGDIPGAARFIEPQIASFAEAGGFDTSLVSLRS